MQDTLEPRTDQADEEAEEVRTLESKSYLKGWLAGYDVARKAALYFGVDIENDLDKLILERERLNHVH